MSSSAHTCHILVVDDDAGISMALVDYLEDEGYTVDVASNGQDALDRLRTGLRPCLILLDWKMPIMNGAQFRIEQQRDAALATIPVAVMSAQLPYVPEEGFVTDVVLPKPFQLDQLTETVARYCAK